MEKADPTTNPLPANNKPMNTRYVKIGIILVAALLIIALAGFIRSRKETPLPAASAPAVSAQVTVDSSGFVPASLTIKKGTTVIWKNTDSDTYAQIASAPYPTHTSVPDLISPKLNADAQYSYTFNNAGTFTYQDQESPKNTGTITVQ